MSSLMEPRPLTSAFESPTFGENSSFYVDQPVGSMSISPCGRDVVLASKEGLHVIDLDSPYSPPRYLPHHTPWEVADVQWSPFAARDHWVVSTSNQKALVWNLAMKTWQNSIEHVLHAHTRAITDINFSAHHPDVIATCSVDSFVHSWDLRTPLRPAITFSDWFAGATQVKWNRQDPHVVASSHDRFLRIWDDRMGAYPIKSIEAHNTKIYGVDWNRVRPGALVTCSLDRTVKFWDYTVEGDVPEKLIRTQFPVWRARNTPFGWGVLAMPQRGNSDLHLYSRRAGGANPNENLPLVHSFPGHTGQVKEFLWRPRGGVVDGIDHREFQLVTWGTDKQLRLHRVEPDVLQRVGYEKGKSFIHNLNVTRSGAVYKTFRDTNEEYDDAGSGLSFGSQGSTSQFPSGTGMNTISIPYARAWTQRGNVETRVGMQGKSKLRADTNPISWMRGVKISGWDIETLGDEITHVGEKFTKVAFESVDVRQRKATISLHGPWSADGASLFLKADIKFPHDYPRASVPTFNIQKTAAVTDQLAARLVSDLRTIAETYLSRKRGCLEGVVRYLLGENTLEESIAWVLGETGETVKSPVNGELGGDDSSDEDEVGLSHSQDLAMSSELLRPVNANVMVPVAKACGALWANDGRLVCFFPPKKDKSTTLFENLGFKEMTRLSRSDKVFEGFGRLQKASPGPRLTGTMASTDDDSDYSDDSDVESSSSSGSSDMLSGLQTRFRAPQTWRSAGSLGFHRPRSTNNSQRSTVGGGTAKTSEASQTVISIHDLSTLLPAKRELAAKYRICGKGTDVCAHNASVALESGYHELAQIWGLVKLILLNQQNPILPPEFDFLRRRAFGPMQRKDSAVDMSYDIGNPGQFSSGAAKSGIQWGNHPFGGHWLIPALFDHFEQIGDVQMVAMLSCVLHESNNGNFLREQRRYDGLPRTEPSFSLDFYSDSTTVPSKSQAVTPVGSTPRDSHFPSGSGRSSSENGRDSSTPPYSTGTTPPTAFRPGPMAAERKFASHNTSIATSPDQQSQSRGGSGIGSVLASSFSRSFTFGPSSASPPASALSRKKQSPNGSPSTSSAWPTSAFSAKPVSTTSDYLAVPTAFNSQTHSDTESDRPQAVSRTPATFKVTMKNRGAFGSVGPAQDSFLDPKNDWVYRSYRTTYSRLLSIWGLPVQQSEVLKIGGVVDDFGDSTLGHETSRRARASFSFPAFGRTNSQSTIFSSDNQGLEIQRHCSSCGHSLELSIFSTFSTTNATGAKRPLQGTYITCANCKPKQPPPVSLPCVICGEVVEGMLVPCLNCGHVSCFDCHRAWFSKASNQHHDDKNTPTSGFEKDFQFCPSGCGCSCSEHINVGIPLSTPSSPGHETERSQRRSRSRPSESSTGPSDRSSKVGQHEDDLDLWQASPFASLARGLGGGLSRGLRGKDDRRKSKPINSNNTTFIPKRSSMNQVENG